MTRNEAHICVVPALPDPQGEGVPDECIPGVAYLLDEFHLLTPEAVPQEVTELGVCTGRIQGLQTRQGLGQVLLHGHGGFRAVLVLPDSSWGLVPGTLAPVLVRPWEGVARGLQGHITAVGIEARREVGVGACRCGLTRRLSAVRSSGQEMLLAGLGG